MDDEERAEKLAADPLVGELVDILVYHIAGWRWEFEADRMLNDSVWRKLIKVRAGALGDGRE